jgi:predicted nucleic acid-binding Zn ribbon protein
LSGPGAGLECPKCRYRFEYLDRTKEGIVRCPKCRKVVNDNRKYKRQRVIIFGVLVAVIFILAFIGMSLLSGSKIY